MTTAIAGPGFSLQKGDGATPENFTTVANVHDIKGPGIKADVHDYTNQSSPGGFEEIIPTILRTEDVTLDINYLPGDPTHNAATGLRADVNNRTKRNWRLLLMDESNSYLEFPGYVVGLSPTAPVNGVLTASVTIKPAGPITQATV